MSNWIAFEGEYTRNPNRSRYEPKTLQTEWKKPLHNGEEFVLYEKRGGLFRKRVDSRILVKICDEKIIELLTQRPHEPLVNAGSVQNFPGSFGYATEDYEVSRTNPTRYIVEGVQSIIQQDIWVKIGRNRIRGVMWTKDGQMVQPALIKRGISYFADDPDPKTQAILAELSTRSNK